MTNTPGTGPCAHCGKVLTDPYKDRMLACFDCRLIAGRAVGLVKLNEDQAQAEIRELQRDLNRERAMLGDARAKLETLAERQERAAEVVETMSRRIKAMHWFLRNSPAGAMSPYTGALSLVWTIVWMVMGVTAGLVLNRVLP